MGAEAIIDLLNLVVSTVHAGTEFVQKSAPTIKEVKKQMPGWFGIGLADQSLFNALLTKLTDDERDALDKFFATLTESQRNQFRCVITSIADEKAETTTTAPVMDKAGNPVVNKRGEQLYNTSKTVSVTNPAIPFLKDVARLVKKDKKNPSFATAKGACLARGMFFENSTHEKIWLGIVALWAARSQGVAFAKRTMASTSSSLKRIMTSSGSGIVVAAKETNAKIEDCMQPLTDHVDAHMKKPLWKRILWIK